MGPSSLSKSTAIREEADDAHDSPVSPGAVKQPNHHGSGAPKARKPANQKKASFAASTLAIQPMPYFNIQSPVVPIGIGSSHNERSYLLENLQRQHERGERLSHALANIEIRLASAQSKSEAKKWRKEIASLKSKIAESRNQEQLILLRLNDIRNEEFACQVQSTGVGVIPYPPQQSPWFAYGGAPTMMQAPVMLPVSPLTPLPPGLYHPSPIVPSPMGSPYWVQLGSVMPSPYEPQNYYYQGHNVMPPFVPDGPLASISRRQSLAPPVTKAFVSLGKDTELSSASQSQAGSYMGRRWSLADAFSPTPKDKRMSIPGLETIWKNKQEEG